MPNKEQQPPPLPELAERIRARAELAQVWLKHYERIASVLDKMRVAFAQLQEEDDFPVQLRTELFSLLAELQAYKQVVEDRKECLSYLVEKKTQTEPPEDPKQMGAHLRFVHTLSQLIEVLEGGHLPDFRDTEAFQTNYRPRRSGTKSDDSFWLWKAERKAYSMRKNEVLPRIREARSILDTGEGNFSKFQEMVKELKEDPDLCDV